MKLLFDQHLSHKLALVLNDLFPDSIHVRDVGHKSSDDELGVSNQEYLYVNRTILFQPL